MKKFFQKGFTAAPRWVHGFTLVELLIVIAVIGILAIAVLAAIDPIEQLKKSRDTAKLADARELVGAYQRFYATKNCFPASYQLASPCSAVVTRLALRSNDAVLLGGATDDLDYMVSSGELKGTFLTKTNVKNGWLYVGNTSTDVLSVCYQAESKNARSGAIGGGLYTLSAVDGSITLAGAACNLTAAYDPTANVANCMVCIQ